jgi:hypothetical protein
VAHLDLKGGAPKSVQGLSLINGFKVDFQYQRSHDVLLQTFRPEEDHLKKKIIALQILRIQLKTIIQTCFSSNSAFPMHFFLILPGICHLYQEKDSGKLTVAILWRKLEIWWRKKNASSYSDISGMSLSEMIKS